LIVFNASYPFMGRCFWFTGIHLLSSSLFLSLSSVFTLI
jgi:hypothetical protein